ncbi:hypothetical protein J7I82_15605 [Oceanobacillus sp. ISL-74]|nr:hypothetical protein [Oceanobacillus sp. ISL-74]
MPYQIGEVEEHTTLVINKRMTTMKVGGRVVCRSIIRVTLIIAGTSLNKRCTVMQEYVHGELLIEMEDNVCW